MNDDALLLLPPQEGERAGEGEGGEGACNSPRPYQYRDSPLRRQPDPLASPALRAMRGHAVLHPATQPPACWLAPRSTHSSEPPPVCWADGLSGPARTVRRSHGAVRLNLRTREVQVAAWLGGWRLAVAQRWSLDYISY